jgi:hypothetical protein
MLNAKFAASGKGGRWGGGKAFSTCDFRFSIERPQERHCGLPIDRLRAVSEVERRIAD